MSKGAVALRGRRMALRLQAMGSPRYGAGFALTLHEDLVDLHTTWKKPRRVRELDIQTGMHRIDRIG